VGEWPALVWDHWYEMLLRIKWDPSGGIFEWYLDNFNTPYIKPEDSDLYTRPAGT